MIYQGRNLINSTILLLVSLTIQAGDDFDQKIDINPDWSNLTEERYIENRMACEYKLQAYKWSKNIWPKENKNPKPDFAEVVDWDGIYDKVHNNLKMQAILHERFNIEITPAMLQHDLDRMAKYTKDAEGLKQLFKLFDNNPQTIAYCVSLPYLVQKKTANSFNWNNEIHAETKTLAKSELDIYQHTLKADDLSVEPQTVIFTTKEGSELIEKTLDELNTIELDKEEFEEKVEKLKQISLQETEYGFIYQEVLSQTDISIKIKTLAWQKQSLSDWLSVHADDFVIKKPTQEEIILSNISSLNRFFDRKSTDVLGEWLPSEYYADERKYHTAIWTGTEVIIWGGFDGSIHRLNSGGRYNPASDSWQASTTNNAPSGRSTHIAIWTGTEMIVWGGYDGNNRLNSGGLYDPIMDSWQATTTTNAPSGRNLHTGVWSGTEVIVWGGFDGNSLINSGGSYNPANDSWLTISNTNAPSSRHTHTAIWSGAEMIVWGGYDGNRVNTGGHYNPLSDSWQATTTSPLSGRNGHTAVWAGTEMIVWGGYDGNQTLNSGACYDSFNHTWLTITSSNAPSVRSGHTAIWDGTEMIIWGGIDDNRSLNSGGRYNPVTNNWHSTTTINAPSGRHNHTAIWSGSEMIVWGGEPFTDIIGVYSLKTDLIFMDGFEVSE